MTRRHPRRPNPLLLATLLGASPALAQTTVTLQPVVVNADAIGGASEQHIDVEAVRAGLGRDLQDVFAAEPSVVIGTGARNGQKIFLRGIEDLNLNVQIDGARQGANNFHHQGRLAVDPFLLRAVTVNTGAAPADGGPGALGGSVRFESVDAQDLLGPRQTAGMRLGAQYESADRSIGGLATVYGLLGDALGVLAHVRRDLADELRVGGGERLPATDGKRGSYLLKASLLDVNGHSVTGSAERNTNTGGPLRANWPWLTSNAVQRSDRQESWRDTYTLRYGYRAADNGLIDLQATLYGNETGIRLADNPMTTTVAGDPTEWLTRSHGMDLRNTLRLRSGAVLHQLTVGIDYFSDRGIRRDATRSWDERARNVGLYAQERMEFGAFRVSGGLRVDRYDTDYANGYSTSGTATSPNLSAEWDLVGADSGHDLTLYAGYGESIRGGKLNQAGWLDKYFLPPDFRTPRPFTLGDNGKLDPERGIQREAGIKWHTHGLLRADDHAGVDLAVFRTTLRDYQIIPGEGVGGITDRITNASGDIRTRGYEIRAHWGTPTFLINAAYSHSKSRDYDGQPLDTTGDSARIGASVGDRLLVDVDWQVATAVRLGYSLEAVARLKDVRPGRPEKPGYAVHGLRMNWQPLSREKLTLTLAVDNLFDRRYAAHSSVRAYYAGSEISNWESGRNVKVGVEWIY